jgi:5-enolpyruvylshikimate-3-phosphate synthase
MSATVTSKESELEIKRSKRLKGQPALQGDGLTGFQALLMGALAEGPTRLENLPDSPWFRDILQDFVRMGYAQQALDGQWHIHGGHDPVAGEEPLRVRHEAELLTLAGFLAAKGCRRQLAIDPACVSGEALEILGRILKLEAPATMVPAHEAGLADPPSSEGDGSEAEPDPYAEENARIADAAGESPSMAALRRLEEEEEEADEAGNDPDPGEAPAAAGEAREAAALTEAERLPREALLLQAPIGLTHKASTLLHPSGAAAALFKPAELGWDEYQAKLTLLAYHLAAGQALDLSLSKGGPDWLETLAAQFGGPIKVEKNEAPEGDELARRIARQMRAAGKSEPQTRIRLGAGAKLKPVTYTIPADITLASAYCLAATLIKGSDITLENVPMNPSRAGFIAALRRMGADIEAVGRRERNGEGLGLLRVRSADLFGKRFAAENQAGMRDEIFLLMVAAAFAEGETVVRDIAFLRKHDRDLLKGFAAALKAAGVEIGEIEDGVVIRGRADYDGSLYDCMGHPGLALAGLVMGLKSHGASTLRNADCLDGRYPGLLDQMAALGAADKAAEKTDKADKTEKAAERQGDKA